MTTSIQYKLKLSAGYKIIIIRAAKMDDKIDSSFLSIILNFL